MKKIGYGRQEILDCDIEAVVDVLKSDYLTQGPKISEFEDVVADYHNAEYAVAFCNGTAALHACYSAIGVSKGDEVITSAITFAASMNGALYENATPVICDIDPQTNCIDVDEVSKNITSKTKAVCPVSFAGYPCDLKKIREVVGNEVFIVHDAAHAIGSKRGNSFGLEYADLAILSFHPVKHITTGEGGMVLTNNKELYEKLMLFRTHGITKNPEELKRKNEGKWYHEMQSLGYNYRMCDIQATLGIEQFKRMESNLHNRNKVAKKYNEEFAKLDWIKTPPTFGLSWVDSNVTSDDLNSYHLYTILVDKSIREEFFNYLHENGIMVQVHYLPIHMHPYYQETFGMDKLSLPNAESYYEGTISLPMFHSMSEEEQDYIIEKVKEFRK